MTEVAYSVAGDGVPVLLIQGVGVAGRAWSPQIDGLERSFQLAWFDARGLGESPGPVGMLDDMARDAFEVLDALGWPSAHVVGHSLGGVIAQRMATLHPERVRTLALICTFAVGRAAVSFSPSTVLLNLRTLVGTVSMRRRAFFELVSGPGTPATEESICALEGAFGRRLDALPPAAVEQLRVLVSTDLRSELGGLDLPTLVISASHDRIAPPDQGRQLAEVLGGEHVVVDGGHAVTVQDPGTINRLLYDFVRAQEP